MSRPRLTEDLETIGTAFGDPTRTTATEAYAAARVIGATRELRDAIEDFSTCGMSDDPSAEGRARAKLRTCYLRYCLTPETRRALGWLLPEDTRPS